MTIYIYDEKNDYSLIFVFLTSRQLFGILHIILYCNFSIEWVTVLADNYTITQIIKVLFEYNFIKLYFSADVFSQYRFTISYFGFKADCLQTQFAILMLSSITSNSLNLNAPEWLAFLIWLKHTPGIKLTSQTLQK